VRDCKELVTQLQRLRSVTICHLKSGDPGKLVLYIAKVQKPENKQSEAQFNRIGDEMSQHKPEVEKKG
jgi:hypothetical protein